MDWEMLFEEVSALRVLLLATLGGLGLFEGMMPRRVPVLLCRGHGSKDAKLLIFNVRLIRVWFLTLRMPGASQCALQPLRFPKPQIMAGWHKAPRDTSKSLPLLSAGTVGDFKTHFAGFFSGFLSLL